MNTKSGNVETSVEFAIDNALDRLFLLRGGDYNALLNEYKEWLGPSRKDLEILIIDTIEPFD